MTANQRRLVTVSAVRTVATVAVLITLYYVLPLDAVGARAVTELIVGVILLVVVLVLQVRVIGRNEHPGVRGVEALSFTVPLFILLFAVAYFSMAHAQPSNFTAPLTRTDSLYFTVTIFTTVGFGDITPKSEVARLIVTGQMVLDLAVIGIVVRLIVDAVKRGQQRLAIGALQPQAEQSDGS